MHACKVKVIKLNKERPRSSLWITFSDRCMNIIWILCQVIICHINSWLIGVSYQAISGSTFKEGIKSYSTTRQRKYKWAQWMVFFTNQYNLYGNDVLQVDSLVLCFVSLARIPAFKQLKLMWHYESIRTHEKTMEMFLWYVHAATNARCHKVFVGTRRIITFNKVKIKCLRASLTNLEPLVL